MGGSEREPPTLAEVLTMASLDEARRIVLSLRRMWCNTWLEERIEGATDHGGYFPS